MKAISSTILALILCFCDLNADWIQKSGFKILSDTVGAISGLSSAPDGKTFYILSSIIVSGKSQYFLATYETKSGARISNRLVNDSSFVEVNRISLSTDGQTMLVFGTKADVKEKSNFFAVRLTDNQIIDRMKVEFVTDQNFPAYSSFAEYSSRHRMLAVFRNYFDVQFYKADRVASSAGKTDVYFHSTDTILSLRLNNNRNSYTPSIGSLSGRIFINSLNYLSPNSYSSDTESRLDIVDSTHNGLTKYASSVYKTGYDNADHNLCIAPNERYVAFGYESGLQVIRLEDSSVTQAISRVPQRRAQAFSADSRYLVALGLNDTATSFHIGYRKICGSSPLPFKAVAPCSIVSVPRDSNFIYASIDGRVCLLHLITDTTSSRSSFSTKDTLQYKDSLIVFNSNIAFPDESEVWWDFGDGTIDKGIAPRHAYSKAGVYSVRMIVRNQNQLDTVLKVSYVHIIELPQLYFQADRIYGKAPLAVQFSNLSTGNIISQKWDFGDGDSSESVSPTHTFTSRKTYSVRLSVFDGRKIYTYLRPSYINADEYRSFSLVGNVCYYTSGGYSKYDSPHLGDSYYHSYEYSWLVRSPSNALFLLDYDDEYSRRYYLGDVHTSSQGYGDLKGIYSNGALSGTLISTSDYSSSSYGGYSGTIQPYRDSSVIQISTLRDNNYKEDRVHIVQLNGVRKIKLPFYTVGFSLKAVSHGVDSYIFRTSSDSSIITFYADTINLLSKTTVYGRALPAFETVSKDRLISIVTPVVKDTLSSKSMSLLSFSFSGALISTAIIPLSEHESFNSIVALGSGRHLLSGTQIDVRSSTAGAVLFDFKGLLKIIDESGSESFRVALPQWRSFDKILRVNDSTYAIAGSPISGLPGFVVLRTNGSIVGDCRFYTPGESFADFTISDNPPVVYYAANSAYNAKLYRLPLNLSDLVDDVQETITANRNSPKISIAPNPVENELQIQTIPATDQVMNYTITSLLGRVIQTGTIIPDGTSYNATISVDNLHSGAYYIRIFNHEWSASSSFMVVH